MAMAEVERVVREAGIVAILDFLSDGPTENPYKHVSDQKLSVFKTDFADVLIAYGGYQRIALSVRPASPDQHSRTIPGSDRVGVTILQRYPLPPDR